MYLCYVDESGNLDLGSPITDDAPNIFVLTGITMLDHEWPRFSHGIDRRKNELRQKLFHTRGMHLELAECELKSNWVRISKERARRPFLDALSSDELTGLVSEFFAQIEFRKMTVFAVVIDKTLIHDYFDQDKLHRKAWELLIERVELFMTERHPRHKALLIRDDMGLQANRNLAAKHAYFLQSGTSANLRLDHIVEMPLFVRSELSNGVQLADLVSYSIYHAFRYQKPEYPFFQRLTGRIYTSSRTDADKLDGLKVFPPESPLTRFPRGI
ncbi:DUF3800 domain-containing protein [bacterium]|nr:DUF3800 domain-containing protein [bacterium]MCB9479183.1 DUF3800 domain-containing protein [Deltaproteobacteria bacterium]